MHLLFKSFVFPLAATLALVNVSLPNRAKAQSYPIDCAILLCLSGGWPASVPCARARAEFIRRITPWPVEPPLQIWRCPMGASYELERKSNERNRLFDILFQGGEYRLGQSVPTTGNTSASTVAEAIWRSDDAASGPVPSDFALRLVQERADIDISGPEFNFVRSIRVFDVRYAWQNFSPRGDGCSRGAAVFLGIYGTQGDFAWQRSSTAALPTAHVGLEQWGDHCPSIYHRSGFVDWRDREGNYGFEQVNY